MVVSQYPIYDKHREFRLKEFCCQYKVPITIHVHKTVTKNNNSIKKIILNFPNAFAFPLFLMNILHNLLVFLNLSFLFHRQSQSISNVPDSHSGSQFPIQIYTHEAAFSSVCIFTLITKPFAFVLFLLDT